MVLQWLVSVVFVLGCLNKTFNKSQVYFSKASSSTSAMRVT